MPIKTTRPRTSREPQLLAVSDLTGGVDLRRSQTLLAPNRGRTYRNWSLEEPGALVVRPGYTAASAATFGSNPQGGARVYLASTVFSLMAIDGAVYRPTEAWVKGASVHSTISTGTQVFFPHDRDLVMVMDGANRPRFSTNGTNWFLAGTDAPSSALAVSTAVGGGLSSGEYAFAYTHKHRGTGHESNASAESTITITSTASAGTITGTYPNSTDAKNDAAVLYARHKLPDAESILRKVSSGAVGSTFSVTSSNWTTNDEVPTTHQAPPALAFGVVWKNRWWAKDATVGNRVRFTEIFLPQAWGTDYYLDIPFEKGDSIAALQPLGDTLLVYGQSGIFLVIGQTSLDFEVRPSQGADSGAFGPRAVARLEQASEHASADGIDSYDGAVDTSLEYDITPAWRDLVVNTSAANLAKVATLYDGLRKELRISVPRVYPTAARGEWVLNLDRSRENEGQSAWATTDRDIAFYMHWNGNEPTAGNRGRIFTVPSTGGFVFEENTGTSANSSNLTAEHEGPGLSFGVHRAKWRGTHLEYESHAGAFSLELAVDGVAQGAIPIAIGAGLVTYGSTITYGTASRTYGGVTRTKAYTPQPMTANGHAGVLKLVYIGQERMKVYTYSHLVVPEPKPRTLA